MNLYLHVAVTKNMRFMKELIYCKIDYVFIAFLCSCHWFCLVYMCKTVETF